jgi:hypothetical protein
MGESFCIAEAQWEARARFVPYATWAAGDKPGELGSVKLEMRHCSSNSAPGGARTRLRREALLGVLAAVVSIVLSACGGDSSPSAPQPFTEQAVIAAFRNAGILIPAVLRYGKSCHPERWHLPASASTTKAATKFACGRLRDAHVDTSNLPRAVLLARTLGTIPNYLINVYVDQNHAASRNFWLKTFLVPGGGGPREFGPVSALRQGNVLVAGFMTKSEIADTNRVFAIMRR